jgi:hypothetical protein
MGYGEVGGGGSLQFSMVYDIPVRNKPNVPQKVHQYGNDPQPRYGDPLVVVVKFPNAQEAKRRTKIQPDGSVTLVLRIDQPDQVRLFWPPFVGIQQPPLPAQVMKFALQTGLSKARLAARGARKAGRGAAKAARKRR